MDIKEQIKSAEEILKDYTANVRVFNTKTTAKQIDAYRLTIIAAMEEYHAQFTVGKQDEEIETVLDEAIELLTDQSLIYEKMYIKDAIKLIRHFQSKLSKPKSI